MLRHPVARTKGESGFTLVELLVVMLIIGLLAAIAIPAFFNQRNKANDASAKEAVSTSQTSMETFSTTNNGSYSGATVALLQAIESAVPPACGTAPCLVISGLASNAYTATVTAKTTGNTFSITRSSAGALTYPCTKPSVSADNGGCNAVSGTAAGTWN